MAIPKKIASVAENRLLPVNINRPTDSYLSKKRTFKSRPVELYQIGDVLSEERSIKLFTLTIQSTMSTYPVEKVWILRSSGRRKAIINYLFHKWLFQSLSRVEKQLFYTFEEVTKNDMIYSALRASTSGHKLKTIRKALKIVSRVWFGQEPPTYEKWLGYRTFVLHIEEGERQAFERKGKKYSGWTRGPKDKGSIAPPREEPFPAEISYVNDHLTMFIDLVKDIESGKSNFYQPNNMRFQL